jgi:hypothetical protein
VTGTEALLLASNEIQMETDLTFVRRQASLPKAGGTVGLPLALLVVRGRVS